MLYLTGCKNTSIIRDKELFFPTNYSLNASKNKLDSIKFENKNIIPLWKNLYKDSALTALIDSALKRNLELQSMDAQIEQIKAGVAFTKGIRLPQLNVGMSAGVRKFGDYTIDGVGNYDTKFSQNLNEKQRIPNHVPDYFIGFQSSWEIDLWGKLKNQKTAAIRRYLASEDGKRLLTTEIVSEIASNYYSLLTLDEQKLKLIENIRLQENAIQVVESQYEVGHATELAVNLTKSQLLETKKMLVEIEQEIISHEIELSNLIGNYPSAILRNKIQISDTLSIDLSYITPEQLLKFRPDILQAEQLMIASNADLESARKAFYPTIQINSYLGLQSFKSSVLFEAPASIAYNIASGLLMPVLNRRELKARLLEARGRKKESYIKFEKTILKAYSEVFEILQINENITKALLLKNKELRLLEKSIESVRELYSSGRSGYLEIITTQEYFLHTQIELLDLNLKKIQIQIRLYKALGGGFL